MTDDLLSYRLDELKAGIAELAHGLRDETLENDRERIALWKKVNDHEVKLGGLAVRVSLWGTTGAVFGLLAGGIASALGFHF